MNHIVKITKKDWLSTSLPEDDFLGLMIKIYPKHKGLALALSNQKINDEITITEAWDSCEYKGKGTFIAGGSGITTFIPMIRNLNRNNDIANNILIYGLGAKENKMQIG